MKIASVQKSRFRIKTRKVRGFLQDRRLRADALFIRAQSAIRADGPPSAQAQAIQFEVALRAARRLQA